MTRTNGENLLAEANSSHLLQENKMREPRPTGSGFNSFLRWFKKNEKNRQNVQLNNNTNQDNKIIINNDFIKTDYYNSNDTLSPPSSPILEKKSVIGSSTDSVFSTATNGFAFISPDNYMPYGTTSQYEKCIAPGPVTDSYRKRVKQQESAREIDKRLELTLRRKYQLFGETEGTINPIYLNPNPSSNYDNVRIYSDFSLPNVKKYYDHNIDENYLWRSENASPKRHRRTVSDSSKDKQSGSYVHVKGKRKAPPPPPLTFTNGTTSPFGGATSATPSSTLNRKKRKAPQPPTSPNNYMFEPIFTEGLLEDKEIKAILENSTNKNFTAMSESNAEGGSSISPSKQLTEKQKQIILENIIKVQNSPNTSENDIPTTILSNDTLKLEKGVLKPMKDIDLMSPLKTQELLKRDDKNSTPLSPISPRPWYKRPLSGNREINIPFKREVVLKTVDKRKTKQKDKEKSDNEHNLLPDVSFSRNSIFESASKLVFFSSRNDNKDKEEKRKSCIGIPNISDLDREAVEIINKENANQHALFLQKENEKYYQPPETSFLRTNFTNYDNKNDDIDYLDENNDDVDDDQRKSTKELISKFEASSNTQRITVNTSFIGRTDLFENVKNKQKETTTSSPILTRKDPITTTSIIEKPTSPIFFTSKITTAQYINENPNEKLFIEEEKDIKKRLDVVKQNQTINNILGKWTCPYCTLENPNWRIICEVCEKIKPYDLRFTKETTEIGSSNNKSENKEMKEQEMNKKTFLNLNPNDPIDWNKKAEKVKQYFGGSALGVGGGKTSGNSGIVNTLTKSASETSIQNENLYAKKKVQSPSKLIGSPKFGKKDYFGRDRILDPIKTQKSLDETILENNNYNNFELVNINNTDKSGLLDSKEVVVTTITTVFQPTDPIPNITNEKFKSDLINEKTPTIDEVRMARLARFNVSSPTEKMFVEEDPPVVNTNSETKMEIGKTLTNQEELEKEKERLREMIRQMNARALAEKYPVFQKGNSPEENTTVPTVVGVVTKKMIPPPLPQPNEPPKLGAIKKLFNRKTNDDEMRENTNKNLVKSGEIKNILPLNEKPIEKLQTIEIFKKMEIKKKNQEQLEINEDNNNNENNTTTDLIQKQKQSNYPIYENFMLTETTTFSPQDNEIVEEITKKLKSKKGLDDFKATLKSQPKQLNDTSTLAINKILKNLEQAISSGQYELASTLAKNLARMKVSLSVTRQRNRPLSTIAGNDENFIVDMFVEDKVSHKGPIQVKISSSLTVTELKNKISRDFNIPVNIQKWILNKQTVTNLNEDLSLFEFGIKDNKSVIYLYLNDPIKEESQLKQIKKIKKVPKLEEKIFLQENEDSEDDTSDCQNETIDNENAGARALPPTKTDNPLGTLKIGWTCPLCTLINSPVRPGCLACSESRPANYVIPKQFQEIENDFIIIKDELKSILKGGKDKITATTVPAVVMRPIEKKNDLNKLNVHRKSSELLNITIEENKTPQAINIHKKNILTTLTEQKNMNIFNQPNTNVVMTAMTTTTTAATSSSASSSPSPNITRNKYRGVDNFNPKTNPNTAIAYQKIEQPKIITPKIITPKIFSPKIITPTPIRPIKIGTAIKDITKPLKIDTKKNYAPQPPKNLRPTHYMELLNLDYADVVPNIDEFECPICFIKYDNGKGVILRDCLHIFCRDCLANTIQYNDDAEIKCPYMDSDYSCESLMQEREIKALVTPEIYEQHLTKSVRQAEHGIENTFHCKTPNCRGWCIYEDNVNQFKCPVCIITNCLTCQAIHDGLNCKQYQDRLNGGCDTNLEARRTKEMLQNMVDKGEAMNCPTCQVVLMKKWGCDWLRCSMCKTEICWVTRGPRWGQGGKGDTTGGCKCGIDGKKCHPKCSYCH